MSAWPERAQELLRRAAELRAYGEHVGAGDMERDAAAIIRMAGEEEHLLHLQETDPAAWREARRRIAARYGWV